MTISIWTLYFEYFKTLKIKAREELNIVKGTKIKVYCSSFNANLQLYTLVIIILNIFSKMVF